jgi:MjaI restriction endonuclease
MKQNKQVENSLFQGKEHVLNYTAQRYGLTRPSKVGPVMELIRQCQPKTFQDWEDFYWQNAITKKAHDSEKVDKELINELGKRLYEKIHGVVIPEWTKAFDEITEDDCVDYIIDVTIRRTFNGYFREKSVVYDNLAKLFPQLIFEESEADLDHAGDIDYVGKVVGTSKIIGIQIKPSTANIAFAGYSVSDRMKKNFMYFEQQFNGKAFVIYSEKEKIMNKEVIEQIREYLNS